MSNATARVEAHAPRAVNACRRCRLRKVKCSGIAPCLNCVNRGQACIFDDADRKVVISERRLRNLERRATASHSQSPGTTNRLSSLAAVADHEEQRDQPSWGTRVPSVIIQDRSFVLDHHRDVSHVEPDDQLCPSTNGPREPKGRKAYNRHVSTWAFSQEVRQIWEPGSSEQSTCSKVDAKISYNISLRDETQFDPSALSLPPNDYIIHLAQVADFHLNANFFFFNHTIFLEQLSRTSTRSLKTASEVWHVKLLLVIALGRLFLERGATSTGPPGIREFLQGVDALPSNIVLSQDPLMAIETLCLLAIYAQAADMHSIAYLYTGQASRIARSCELDRIRHLYDDLEPTRQNHAQKLWLTVCVLDQRHSATIGASPDYLVQEQNDSLLASVETPGSVSNFALRFNLSVANLLTRVMTVLSKHASEGTMSSSFMNKIIVELAAMRNLGQKMSNLQQLCHERSLLTISRPEATLHLLYYHCIISATKPILMHLIKLRLNQDDHFASANASSKPEIRIMRTCVNAASLTLNIVSALHEQNLLETFLFFDLEVTFLAALSLVLANIIIPNITESSFVEVAKAVLQDMSCRGNVPATSLKCELDDICRLASNLPPSLRGSSHPSILRKPVTMIQDGRVLNAAVLKVIEIQHTARQSDYDPNILQATAQDTSIEDQWPRPETQESQTQTQNPSERPSLLSTGNSMPYSNEIYIDNIDAVEHAFSFDMEDLQWLDSV